MRFWLGVRALLVGIETFGAYRSVATPLIDPTTGQPDASGVMVNVNIKHYALANYAGVPTALKEKFSHEQLLPRIALAAFDLSHQQLFTRRMLGTCWTDACQHYTKHPPSRPWLQTIGPNFLQNSVGWYRRTPGSNKKSLLRSESRVFD